MKKRLGKNSAMMTVELGVSLVLIVVVLFVVIGLFNDNIKSMIGSSNFSRLFSANGLKTLFQSFNRNYDDSQIYVQIMGEQGLQMLRQKANNNDENLIDAAQLTPGSTNPQTVNTILYLARVSRIIMNDNYICKKIKSPSTALCVALDGIAYEVIDNGDTITIKGYKSGSANSLTLPVTKQVTMPTISSTATAKEKLAAIQQIAAAYGAAINSNYALTREINNFTTAMASAGAQNNIESELINLLGLGKTTFGGGTLGGLLNQAMGDCTYNVVDNSYPPGCSPNVDSADLSAYNTLVASLFIQMQGLMNSTTYTGTPSIPSSSGPVAYLPSTQLPPAYKPTINADDNWYSANAVDESIIEGSEDALVMTTLKDDPLSLLAPEGENPILSNSSDAYYNCSDTDLACSECYAGGGLWSGTTCKCSSGYYWAGSTCMVNGSCSSGYYWNGTGCSPNGGGTVCNAGTLPFVLDCIPCTTVLDDSGVCCSTGILDPSGSCVQPTTCSISGSTITCTAGSSITVASSTTANPVTVNYTSAVTGSITSSTSASFDGAFVSGGKYMTDYYMSKLSGTNDASMSARIKVLTLYNDLFRAVLNRTIDRGDGKQWTVGSFLGQDTKRNSCNTYKTTMMNIAKEHGLTSMYDYFNTISTSTLCPVN